MIRTRRVVPVGVDAATRAQKPALASRVYFFFGVLAGLFPAYFGLTDPAKLDRAFSWTSLPPLHARFVGAFYLFAVLYTLGLLLARHRWQVGSGFLAVTIFTGVTGILAFFGTSTAALAAMLAVMLRTRQFTLR